MMATHLDAGTVAVELVERGEPMEVTLRDGADVVVLSGSAGDLLALAQSLRSVVEIARKEP